MCGRIANTALVAGLLLAIAACSSQPPPARAVQARRTTCQPAQLALGLDSGGGRFDGMSHSGTSLVLRNAGETACAIAAQPMPAFMDADRHALDIAAQDASAPHADTMRPITLAPGASVASDMRWVSGNVYENGHCESPAFITLAFGEQTLAAPFAGHLCGAAGKPSSYTLTPWRPTAAPSSTTAKTLTYTCEDHRTVLAAYPDAQTATLTLDGRTHRLHLALSADGTRYVGDHWQWWTKGLHQARLAPLAAGENIASAQGVACQTP